MAPFMVSISFLGLVFPFMASLSFYSLSVYGFNVFNNTCNIFSAIIPLPLLQSSCYNLNVYLIFSSKIFVSQASPKAILSYYISELYPILLYYRSTFRQSNESKQYPQVL